ncbi:glycosyl hydrolase family 18 protein [Carnobacterium divergens]|uniref:chitinase n=1 Tax=Carnobacterium divergens TaxID=2748 RepID=A0A7Z8CZU5_CARDV|nr:glycosyl hydrolase family 18 protein [Carnobacterium divergens]TFI74271.1 chitinase [Carnobacterium divergens]TFI78593.1 chitinase [Carnobacterium divergens]TFI85152.1 chitinase [Carnobacterium divergens]TFI97508.1 chitinase [Carnobacterium divergens]TFJ13768.1 chitinase [Carnobacterium divergens]
MKKMNRKVFGTFATILLTCGLAASTVVTVAIASPEKVQAAETAPYRNVMYYGDWSIWGGEGNFYPKDIPADQLTHLNFAFMDFDSNGNFKFTDKDAAVGAPVGQEGVQWGGANAGVLNALQDLRASNPNMKIGISIGGWSKSANFSTVAANPTARANFVANAMKFVKYTNMDFVDIDWEYPTSVRQPDTVDNKNDTGTPNATPADKDNYITLLKDLRAGLEKQGTEIGKKYELTVALPASQGTLAAGIDVANLFKVVDFANVMTYDMNGAWGNQSAHHTALYGNPKDPQYNSGLSVDQTVKYLEDKGASPDKIVIGSAFYTRGWNKVAQGNDPLQPGLFQAAEKNNKDADLSLTYGAKNEKPLTSGDGGRAGGVWAYRSIDALKKATTGLTEYWDDVAKAPYLYSKDTGEFFSYDNTRSIGYKSQYVKDKKLGGIISWMQSQDKPTTSTKRDELTKAIKTGLLGNTAIPSNPIVYTNLNVQATITPYNENGAGYEITIKNNEVANESNEVLKLTELAFETVKTPKFYLTTSANETLTAGDYTAGTVTTANGMTAIDLSSVYDGQTIPQGASYKFRLKSSAAEVDVKNIQKISLTQRMAKNGVELGKQDIYTGSGEVTPPDPNDTVAPSVPTNLVASNVTGSTATVTWAASTDNVKVAGYKVLRDGVEVSNVTNGVSFTDTNLKAATTYNYTVKAYDAAGNSSAASAALVVKTTDTPPPATNEWSATKVYVGGDIVTYQGHQYKAKWWTQGNTPGAEVGGPWELIK